MAKAKLKLEFKGLEEYASKLDKLGKSDALRNTVEKALEESAKLVKEQLQAEMKRHHRTGKTEKSLVEPKKVEWSGTVASVNVGFDLAHGGLPSIFLMYGTPKQAKDQRVYNAVYGSNTKKKIKQVQEEAFKEAIANIMGGF